MNEWYNFVSQLMQNKSLQFITINFILMCQIVRKFKICNKETFLNLDTTTLLPLFDVYLFCEAVMLRCHMRKLILLIWYLYNTLDSTHHFSNLFSIRIVKCINICRYKWKDVIKTETLCTQIFWLIWMCVFLMNSNVVAIKR